VDDPGGVWGPKCLTAQEHLRELLYAGAGRWGRHSSHPVGYGNSPRLSSLPAPVRFVYQRPPSTVGLHWHRYKVRNAPEWNHQAFADDLSLYTENTADADTLLRLVQQFQEWTGLKISTKKSLATGALYGREVRRGRTIANAKARRAKAHAAKSRRLTAACKGDDAYALGEQDLQVEGAVHTIQRNAKKVICKTCGNVKESHHFYVTDPDRCCRQCATSWSPNTRESN